MPLSTRSWIQSIQLWTTPSARPKGPPRAGAPLESPRLFSLAFDVPLRVHFDVVMPPSTGSWIQSIQLWTTPSARPKGPPRAGAPLDTPRPWWCTHPTRRNHEGRGRSAVLCDEHGPLPLVISSQNVVLVDDVGSLLARTNGRRFVLYDRARMLEPEQLCHRNASGRGEHVTARYIAAGPQAPRPEAMLRIVTCSSRPDARDCRHTTSGERTSANLSMNRMPRPWFAPATDPTSSTSTQPVARSRERVATRAQHQSRKAHRRPSRFRGSSARTTRGAGCPEGHPPWGAPLVAPKA